MKKNEFKKYRLKIIIFNLSFYILIMTLLILALYNKSINDLLFLENFFTFIWVIVVVLALRINFKYFEKRNKYYSSKKITIKENKKLKKILFYFFLFTTIINIFLFVFSVATAFIGCCGFTLPENFVLYSFLTLPINISLLLATIIL
jgi:hypothetical protein